jgi:hypothetical protein
LEIGRGEISAAGEEVVAAEKNLAFVIMPAGLVIPGVRS